MDERQTQIRERAGLEESLLNQDFIDWLRKWGTPILMVAALSAVAYTLYLRYQVGQSQRVDKAFAEFELARAGASASPSALAAVATEFEGVRAVSMLARLEAADRYVDAVRRRMKIGAELAVSEQGGTPTGALAKPEDALTDADREDYLSQAASLYQRVHDDAATNSGNLLTRVNAMYGLAAVAECRRDWEDATQWYNRIASLVDGTTYVLHKKVAEQRVKELEDLKKTEPLPLDAQVPKPPPPPAPPAPAAESAATPPAGTPEAPPAGQASPPGEPPPATDGPKR
ncbi:MAG: hypothetical protein DYG92_06260 [Leptolyngbya sp. PLA1]|nr:hypothetical protein [Leptolyngbya sp. PLA1]